MVRLKFQTANSRYTSAFPRRNAPESCMNLSPPKQRAWGMPGARCTRSLACKSRKHASKSPRSHRDHPAFPHAMVLTVSFVLSPVIGLVCHRHQRNCFHRLDAGVEASGPHDFAVHEKVLSSAAPSASTASRSASVTIAIRPSCGARRRGYRSDLGQQRSGIFLEMGLDGANQIDPSQQIPPCARARVARGAG
jgi:hypothetical protein